jgi:CheY-like chemotaxis protein
MSDPASATAASGLSNHQPRRLRVLVADDDPASRLFFAEALRRLGADPLACADGIAALDCARSEAFDLLLLDCRMPGAGAMQILAELRRDGALSAHGYAVATSADIGAADRTKLLAAGFDHVLAKPCAIDDLQRVLALAEPGRGGALLDNDAALRSSGEPATMRALRGLLRTELAGLHRELDDLRVDRTQFAERLHRLRSSCGFCGAPALGAEAARLQQYLTGATGGELGEPLIRFRRTLLATLEALDGGRKANT